MIASRWKTACAAAVLSAGAAFPALAAETMPLEKLSHIHGLAVDRKDPGRLLVATHHGLFTATPDGTAVQVSAATHDFMGFTPHPTERDTYLGSGHPAAGGNLGVIRSTDGGRTWSKVANGYLGPVDFHAMAVSKADPQVIYGLYGQVQMSRDGGRTWTQRGRLPARPFALAASARAAERVYAATEAGLLISEDGGNTWTAANDDTRPVSGIHIAKDGSVLGHIVGLGVVTATEPVKRWHHVAMPDARALLHITADDTNSSRVFAVDEAGKIVASTDGGDTWRAFAAR